MVKLCLIIMGHLHRETIHSLVTCLHRAISNNMHVCMDALGQMPMPVLV